MFFVARGVAAACSKGHQVVEADRVQCLPVGVHTRRGLLQFVFKQQLVLLVCGGLRRKVAAGRHQA